MSKKPGNKQLVCFILSAVLVTTALGCRLFSQSSNSTAAGKIVFQDHFSDPNSGWNRATADSGITDYADGAYRILVRAEFLDIWARPGLNLSEVTIQVDAIKVDGDRNNRLGVLCRLTQPNQFYTFIISSDGYYGIGKVNGQDYRLIGMEALQHSEAIQTGSGLNHIQADCIGDTLTLYVNNQRIAQVRDSEYKSGDVGLIAGTYDIPGTDILFDNFIVSSP